MSLESKKLHIPYISLNLKSLAYARKVRDRSETPCTYFRHLEKETSFNNLGNLGHFKKADVSIKQFDCRYFLLEQHLDLSHST